MGFKRIMGLEVGRFLEKRKMICLLVFYLLSLYFIQSGIGKYKNIHEEMKHFQEFERTRIEHFQYYYQYGFYGFRLLYVPGPLSALFENAGIFTSNLNAFIDSGERLKIYEAFKGKNAFIGYASIFMNISGLLFLLGSLLSLLFGLETFKDKHFLKLLDNIKGNRKKLFWSVLTSRLFILLSCCLMIIATTWLLYMANGVTVSIGYLAIYGLVLFLMQSFFLFWGILAGFLKNERASLVAIFAVWLLFVFGIPAIVGKIVYKRAESIFSVNEMDIEKFKLMMSFEQKARDEAGQMDENATNTEIRRKLFNYLLANEFKKIMGYENTMITEMKDTVSLHHNLSLIFPTSFFLSVNNEISGRGYEGLINFYEYAFKHKNGFVRFYGDRSFFSDEKKVEPYLKEDENVFSASSFLPDNFVFGVLFCILWVALPLSITFFLFNKFFQLSSKKLESDLKEKLQPENWKKNKTTVFITDESELPSQFSRILGMREISHIMVPNPGDLPGMVKVAELCRFFGVSLPDGLHEVANKCISKVKPDKQALLILDLIKDVEAEFLVFDNFIIKLSDSGIELFCERLESLKKGRKIAYFSRSQLAAVTFSDAISKG